MSLCFGLIPTTVGPMLINLPIGALAGAILMTLPQALAFTLAPDASQGAAAGLVDFSRGVGVVLGPVLVGAAVDRVRGDAVKHVGLRRHVAHHWRAVLLSLFLLRRFDDSLPVGPDSG